MLKLRPRTDWYHSSVVRAILAGVAVVVASIHASAGSTSVVNDTTPPAFSVEIGPTSPSGAFGVDVPYEVIASITVSATSVT